MEASIRFLDQNFSFPNAEARMSNNMKMLGWNVSPEDMKQIPEHWLSFEEPPASIHYLLAIIYFFFMIASLVGNGMVIWIFGCSKSLRTPSNMFIINLAICDFFMMLKAPIFLYNSMHRGFETGILGCKIFAIMGSFSGIGAGMTNAAIAYDRYSTIARPLDGRLSMTKAILFVFLIWLYTTPWAVAPFLEIWGRFVPEGFLTTCTFDYLTQTFDNQMFVGTIFTFSYVIPMSMIIYYYSQIVSHVVNHEKAMREQAKKMNVESLKSNADTQKMSVEVRIAKTAITVCFLFVASWTPYAVCSLIGAFGNQALLTPGVTMIPAVCCKFVACVDPWCYAISHPKYRLELQNKLPWLGVTEKQIEAVSNSTNVTPMTETSTTAT